MTPKIYVDIVVEEIEPSPNYLVKLRATTSCGSNTAILKNGDCLTVNLDVKELTQAYQDIDFLLEVLEEELS